MSENSNWLVPGYPALQNEVGQAAVDGKVRYFPQVVRQRTDPPVVNQTLGLLSWVLFDQPKMVEGKPVYGYIKLRGNHSDQSAAMNACHKIVKEVDSYHKVLIAPVGNWLPITDNDSFVGEKVDVKMNENEIHLRDEAMLEKRKREEKIARELQERTEELRREEDKGENDTLTYYATKRNTDMKVREEIERQEKRLDSLKETHRKVLGELYKLEVANPEYREQWVECYNKKRREVGIADFVEDPVVRDAFIRDMEMLKMAE